MLGASVFQSEINIGDPILIHDFSQIVVIEIPNRLKTPKQVSLIQHLAE
jgi:hypothetical protein